MDEINQIRREKVWGMYLRWRVLHGCSLLTTRIKASKLLGLKILRWNHLEWKMFNVDETSSHTDESMQTTWTDDSKELLHFRMKTNGTMKLYAWSFRGLLSGWAFGAAGRNCCLKSHIFIDPSIFLWYSMYLKVTLLIRFCTRLGFNLRSPNWEGNKPQTYREHVLNMHGWEICLHATIFSFHFMRITLLFRIGNNCWYFRCALQFFKSS